MPFPSATDIDLTSSRRGFTFPLGTFCTATTQLGKELGSSGFKILGTILSLIEVLLWLFLSILTLVQVLQGKV